MAATEQSGQIREALRRFLPGSQSTQAVAVEMDSSVVKVLEAKVADAFKKYPFLPTFRLIEGTGEAAGEANARDLIYFVYALDASEGEAWIELPISFVKAAFIGTLGGAFAIQSNSEPGKLTAAERRFAGFLAQDMCAVVVPVDGRAALSQIVQSDPPEHAEKPGDRQQFRFAATFGGSKTLLQVHIPLPPGRTQSVPSNESPFADAAGRIVVAPQVRLQLRALTLSEVAALKQGDIISASSENAAAPAQILVDRKAIFACELGKIGDRYSARVTGPVAGLTQPQTNDRHGWGI